MAKAISRFGGLLGIGFVGFSKAFRTDPLQQGNLLRKEEGRPLRKEYNGYPIPQKEKNFYNLEKSFK